MSVELLDEEADDSEIAVVSWLSPLHPPGHVADSRTVLSSGELLPFIWVNFISGEERVEESVVDDLVSVHTLCAKGDGGATARREFRTQWKRTHRRMLELARYLPDVTMPGGRIASIDFCDVAMRPRTEEYGDEQILRKVGRYRIGLSYAKL